MKDTFSRKIDVIIYLFWVAYLIFVIFLYFTGASERTLIYNFSLVIIGLLAIIMRMIAKFTKAIVNLTNTLIDSKLKISEHLFDEKPEKKEE